MSEVEDFLSQTMPRMMEADRALHNGDAGPRLAMCSRNEPLTLFGAWHSDSGWDDVNRTSAVLASRFSDCTAYDVELVAAGASNDLAYTVTYEHTSTSIEGTAKTYMLRVTQIYRREHGEWRLAHRHGDEFAAGEPRLTPTA
jgi:ketosteroid isomerase-like protein